MNDENKSDKLLLISREPSSKKCEFAEIITENISFYYMTQSFGPHIYYT